jgi:cation diffusion facilitator CzcD-associated flavoprotein CzcO
MAVDTEPATSVDIAIIGAGFSGLGTAIKLRERGIDDFVVLERHDDVGGTWWANTYPGCACDVPSHLYSYSFAPNPEWTQTYSPQPEIRAYLQRCAREHDLYRSIRLGTTVTAAAWDDEAGRWELQTSAGPVRARVLIAGMGPLTEPSLPDLPASGRSRAPCSTPPAGTTTTTWRASAWP